MILRTHARSLTIFTLVSCCVALAMSSIGSAAEGLAPEASLAKIQVPDGLEAKVFAAEPMLLSPSNIDVDHRGRVWVCEVVNYRGRNGQRREGDRILILEDTNNDGKADKQTVFYQGRDVDSALGICVLGNKVIVSCAPTVFVFTDTNGDDKPDSKEVLFSKVGQPQHDHSTHAFTFGPDGKYYWCVGNTGKHVHDKDGKIITDLAGNEVRDNGQPYYGGMPFRCDTDGSNFEVLGHNFRNNYEVTVDSFGALWQSDNDDDGNRGVRINFVMEYGNYGYRDELTGAGWRSPRTGMESEIPLQHWHLNDPGVVPNLLQTGAGSPCGICVYEGDLMPEKFRNQMLHCDAGPNIVRAYPVKTDGAGYTAEIANIMDGKQDRWFRPSDVCVAPDGSLMIADWYDPGVGGHAMGDIDKGRIFRVAPPNTPYKSPVVDVSTPEAACETLKSPNGSTRYLAWTALHEWQGKAEPALQKLYADKNPRYRARALWLLGKIKGRADHYARQAMQDSNTNIRMTGLRLMRQETDNILPYIELLSKDASPAVRRECLVALRNVKSNDAANLWTTLANQYDGKDRWYLEALGIAADGRWDACLDVWMKDADLASPASRNIVWRSRGSKTPEHLAKIINDSNTPEAELPRYLRAFDYQDKDASTPHLIAMAFKGKGSGSRLNLVSREALSRLPGGAVNAPENRVALKKTLARMEGTSDYIDIVKRLSLKDEYPKLLDLAAANPADQLGIESIRALLSKNEYDSIAKGLYSNNATRADAIANVLVTANDAKATGLLTDLMNNKDQPLERRGLAARGVAQSQDGARDLAKRAEENKIPAELKQAVAVALHMSNHREAKAVAEKLFPLPAAKDAEKLPPLRDLARRSGNAEKGKVVFNTTGTCATCHIVNEVGKEVGPNLSEIGSKLSRQAAYESILYPSAGISHNYETHTLVIDDGTTVTGIITSETANEIKIKDAKAIVRTYAASQVEEKVKQNISIMPADLQKTMSLDDLTNVVEYLTTLKKK